MGVYWYKLKEPLTHVRVVRRAGKVAIVLWTNHNVCGIFMVSERKKSDIMQLLADKLVGPVAASRYVSGRGFMVEVFNDELLDTQIVISEAGELSTLGELQKRASPTNPPDGTVRLSLSNKQFVSTKGLPADPVERDSITLPRER